MKIEERIILYLDNQMNDSEQMEFEKEIQNSKELQKLVEKYRMTLNNLKMEEKISLNETYFVNLLPKIRKKLYSSPKSIFIKPSIEFISLILIIGFTFFISIINMKKDFNSFDNLISTLNENEAAQIFTEYDTELSAIASDQVNGSTEALLSELIESELNLNEEDVINFIVSDAIGIDNVFNEMKSNETEEIYAQLLQTKFF